MCTISHPGSSHQNLFNHQLLFVSVLTTTANLLHLIWCPVISWTGQLSAIISASSHLGSPPLNTFRYLYVLIAYSHGLLTFLNPCNWPITLRQTIWPRTHFGSEIPRTSTWKTVCIVFKLTSKHPVLLRKYLYSVFVCRVLSKVK